MKLNIRLLLFVWALCFSQQVLPQSFKELYQEAQLDEDTLKQFRVIAEWEKATPNADDIDLYKPSLIIIFQGLKKK